MKEPVRACAPLRKLLARSARVAVALLSVAMLALAGCGDDAETVESQGPNEPLLGTSPRQYELREIDGDEYVDAGAAQENTGFTSDLVMSLSPTMPGAPDFRAYGFTLVTPCGFWTAHDAEINENQIVTRTTKSHLNDRRCTADQADAIDEVVAVFEASPRYRFDGSVLTFEADHGATLRFELHVRDVEASTERARVQALAEAEARGLSAQVAVLRNGAPSFDEYKQAMETMIECARAAGVDITGPLEGTGGRLDYRSTAINQAELDRCYEEHFRFIDAVYQISLEG